MTVHCSHNYVGFLRRFVRSCQVFYTLHIIPVSNKTTGIHQSRASNVGTSRHTYARASILCVCCSSETTSTHALLLEFIFSRSNLCNESQYPVLTFVFLAKYGNFVHDFEFCLPCLLNTRRFYMRTLFYPGTGMS